MTLFLMKLLTWYQNSSIVLLWTFKVDLRLKIRFLGIDKFLPTLQKVLFWKLEKWKCTKKLWNNLEMAKLQEKRKKVKKLILTLLLEQLLRNISSLSKMVGIYIFQKLFLIYLRILRWFQIFRSFNLIS